MAASILSFKESIENLASALENEQVQMAVYHRIRDALCTHIAAELLLPQVRKAFPLRK
jgi:hypothetical protein